MGNWASAGLTAPYDSFDFDRAFREASENAEHIHFNLEGIDNPISYANQFGSSGRFPPRYPGRWTAVELYIIKNQPLLCNKTTFYEMSSYNPPKPAPDQKAVICGSD
jgi:hypothetical protein